MEGPNGTSREIQLFLLTKHSIVFLLPFRGLIVHVLLLLLLLLLLKLHVIFFISTTIH